MKPTKTKYQYIEFIQGDEPFDGKPFWYCRNIKNRTMLGGVSYYGRWKQHVFSAADDSMIFSASCLADIQHFIGQLDAKSTTDVREHEGGC